jgi:uncharacterized protein (TIGR02145 family)
MKKISLKYYLAMVVVVLSASILSAQSTYIQVVSEPGILVFLDELFKGKTNADMGGFIIENVLPGNHTIKVIKAGFNPQTENLGIKQGEVFTYKVKPFVPAINDASFAKETNTSAPGLLTTSQVSGTNPTQVTGANSSNSPKATVTDIDGNIYNIVIIGTQTWMKENLKTTRYRDGSTISSFKGGAYYWYNNDINNKNVYGALYNYFAVEDRRNLCPAGWHISTEAEWIRLETFFGGQDIAGEKIMRTGDSDFSGLLAGLRSWTSFSMAEVQGYWWTSEGGIRMIDPSKSKIWHGFAGSSKKNGLSVRCLKD